MPCGVGADLRRRVVGVGPRRGRWVRFRAGRAPFRGVRLGAIVADSAGVAQLVERQLPKLNVAGSSPVSRFPSPGSTNRCFVVISGEFARRHFLEAHSPLSRLPARDRAESRFNCREYCWCCLSRAANGGISTLAQSIRTSITVLRGRSGAMGRYRLKTLIGSGSESTLTLGMRATSTEPRTQMSPSST